MVLQKTLDYGFVGYQIPRATRSARKSSSFRKQINDNPMCAFDLLATVAGNLLSEKESSCSSSVVKKEPHSEDTPFEGKLEKVIVSEIVSKAPTTSKDFPHVHNEDHSGLASVVTYSDCSEKIEDLKSTKKRILLGSFANKVEAPKTENVSISTKDEMYCSDIRLVSDTKLPLCNEHITSDFVPVGGRDDVKLVIRDDDENSSRCTKFGTGMKAFRPSPHVGDRRIKKLLASNYWKVTSKSKESTNYKADSKTKPVYQCRKNCYKRLRSQRDYPLKKRRLYRCSSASNFDGGINGDNVVSLPSKEFSLDVLDSGAKVNGGSGISACVAGQPTPLKSRDSNVKLRIKSFKVPELFIEIPENATIGNLKRRVLETVTALLGGGLRVGVLVQGKKIRDDNRILLQTGLSYDDVLEDIGFSLEPNSCQSPSALQNEDYPSLLSRDTPLQLERYPASPRGVCSSVQSKKVDALSDTPLLNLGNFIESDHDSAPSLPDMSQNKKDPSDSGALVVVEAEALSMIPLKKTNRLDASQRRIRRPFSVTEVEALVQAIEKLGTGRWRDVKLRAFDNAKHRTYVDLKDKWKTLVHTARISPQQRRGEPVPQDLLDRVLRAHAYWSQQQVKQQLKHHSETRLLL